jgi:uncharacterized protein YmfQ (DUF2313 family)
VIDQDDYARMQWFLLPPGRLWADWIGSTVRKVFRGAAAEIVRLQTRAFDLIRESNPATSEEMIEEWENSFDLPHATDLTLAQRQAKVVGRLILRQRVRPVDYQTALAPILGLDPEQLEVIEIFRADAIATDDDRAHYRFYVYRDPGLGGTYNLPAAQSLVDDVEHSYTQGKIIESKDFLADDPYSLCDRDLLGV